MNLAKTIDRTFYPAIGKIFTPLVMDQLISKGHSKYLAEVSLNSGLLEDLDPTTPLSHFFDRVYHLLFKNYRNEYLYKNTIANKVLLGKYSLNTSSMLTELRVGKCKADAVIINGTSTVYEIKSAYDTFARLQNQIQTYLEVFDHINVITSNSQLSRLGSILPQTVGIQVLTDRNTISTIRESKSNRKNTNQSTLFNSMRKDEYLRVIKAYTGAVPDLPNTLMHRECKKIFCKIPAESAHDLTMSMLRTRNKAKILGDVLSTTPKSLSAYVLSIGNDKSKLQALMHQLTKTTGTTLSPNFV